MTIGEVTDILKTKITKEARDSYHQALMMSAFVVKQFNGKEVPRIDEIYPSLFPKPEEDYENNKLLWRQWVSNWNNRKKQNDA